MSQLLIGTSYVSMDEPSLGLYEMHMQSPGSKGFHRYQIILVMRGETPTEFRRDLGPASKFRKKQVTEFRIPSGVRDEETGRIHCEHTVGELVDIADRLRNEKHEPLPVSDLLGGYHKEMDKRRSRRTNRTAFGSVGR